MADQIKESIVEFSVEVAPSSKIAPEDIDEMTRNLQNELAEQSFIEGTEQESRLRDDGSKSVEFVTLLKSLPSKIPAVVDFIQEWVLRPGNHSVKLKVKGDVDIVELEFDPRTLSPESATQMVSKIQSRVR